MATEAETVHISTPTTSLVLDATEGQTPRFIYYGNALSGSDLANLEASGAPSLNAYPVYGLWPEKEAAFAAVHADGNMTLDMAVSSVSTRTDADGSTVTTITLKDKEYPFTIDLNYRSWTDEDVIETWTEASHQEKGKVRLTRFMSGYLPLRYGPVHVSQLYGSWANEGRVEEAPLPHGLKVIKNKDGVRNSHTAHSEVMISLDGPAMENSGRTIGAALCYGGNYKLMFDTDDSNYHHFFAGINEENSAYNLAKGEKFVTPPLALTYSGEGLGGVSRNFHRWGRNHRLAHGTETRKILLGWRLLRHHRGGLAADVERLCRLGRLTVCHGRRLVRREISTQQRLYCAGRLGCRHPQAAARHQGPVRCRRRTRHQVRHLD